MENLNTVNNFEQSFQRLNSNMENKHYFRKNQLEIISETTISENYEGKNRRYSYFLHCDFINCNFIESGFAGSVFSNCRFNNCLFDYSNFQSCDFRDCSFIFTNNHKNTLTAVRFMKSVFYKCSFNNIIFNSVNFCECIVNNNEVANSKFISCAFEDMLVKNTMIQSVRFSSQNFDFLKIQNIITKDVILPFPAAPCITNGIEYVISTKDNIKFTSEGNKTLTKEEYKMYIPDFIEFYKHTKNYYFLANILLSLKKYKESFNYIQLGIRQSVSTHNFRMVKHFAQLLNDKAFNIQDKKRAYKLITSELNKITFQESDIDNLNLYISDIKSLLFNKSDLPYLTLNLQTNIPSNDYDNIIVFYGFLEKIIDTYIGKEETHSIEIRHNSDVNFYIELFSDPERLFVFLAAVFECCNFTNKISKSVIKQIKKYKHEKHANSTESDADTCDQSNHETNIEELLTDKPQINITNNIQIKEANHCVFNVNNISSELYSSYNKR